MNNCRDTTTVRGSIWNVASDRVIAGCAQQQIEARPSCRLRADAASATSFAHHDTAKMIHLAPIRRE
jgi:hypothetical protein